MRLPKTIVQKFGGSSLSSPELREIAASRVLEARQRGAAPVVVCSALGRRPDPYATDSLLALLGPSLNGPESRPIARRAARRSPAPSSRNC